MLGAASLQRCHGVDEPNSPVIKLWQGLGGSGGVQAPRLCRAAADSLREGACTSLCRPASAGTRCPKRDVTGAAGSQEATAPKTSEYLKPGPWASLGAGALATAQHRASPAARAAAALPCVGWRAAASPPPSSPPLLPPPPSPPPARSWAAGIRTCFSPGRTAQGESRGTALGWKVLEKNGLVSGAKRKQMPPGARASKAHTGSARRRGRG